MSGFASSALTMLLGWLRTMISRLWLLLGSAEGGSFMSFFRTHWTRIFIAFCIGGFVVDRLIYLIRWRPYYVWGTKWDRFKRRLKGERPRRDTDYSAYAQRSIPSDSQTSAPYAPYSEEPSYAPNPFEGMDSSQEPMYEDDFTIWSSPVSEQTQVNASPYYRSEPEPAESFDEPFDNPGENLSPEFGISRPEPIQYLEDVQASFAPLPAPEALYPPPSEPPKSDPVHPGLDLETFQKNVGLASKEEAPQEEPEEALLKPATGFSRPSFLPFSQSAELDNTQRGRSSLSNLAKKARTLVSIHDEDNPLTIRDLQSTVNVRDAFHAPVFPNKADEEIDDE